ncbi:MAG: ferric reductase-like transmembrane domain-containing protein [Pseudomonadota bacterium]
MRGGGRTSTKAVLVWAAVILAVGVPIVAAAFSPQLAWRHPPYIAAGFAGIVALALLLIQPLLIGGYLPGFSSIRARSIHRWIGGLLVVAILVHVGGLWITSAPDVIDALLFRSPTPFSVWGVIAMWAVFVTALIAAFRTRLRIRPRTWRLVHASLAVIVIIGTVIHAVLIQGTMETFTKYALCALVIIVALKVFIDLRIWVWRAKSR